MIKQIIDELNVENGSNYKMSVLKKHKSNGLLKKVLRLCYDTSTYRFGVSLKQVLKTEAEETFSDSTLEFALDKIEELLVTRKVTGNAALTLAATLINSLNDDDASILRGIINRDLRINMGRTNINKVFSNLIKKPVYMRCATYNEKSIKKINFPAVCQIKADGKFCSVSVQDGKVEFVGRSGKEFELPHIESVMKDFPNGIYNGELLVYGVEDRQTGNGILNSLNSKEDVYITLWDYITNDDYSRPKDKNNKVPYHQRFSKLYSILNKDYSHIKLTETHIVNCLEDALLLTSKWMNAGLEGSILKDTEAIFRDGTSQQQLKMKIEMSLEMRITGFKEGKAGTVRELTFGSLLFENDEGTISGAVSGFTDEQLQQINSNRCFYIGKIIEIGFNDLIKAKNSDIYSLSHSKFIEFRDDKNETDTLEKAFKTREMAITLTKDNK